MFLIGKWGKILDGEYANWYLMVDDDTNGSTGGFYIYTVKNPKIEKSEGYDDWVENERDLDNYMKNFKSKIDWKTKL